MPDSALALDQWTRYTYCRDNGHVDFVEKAALCDDFFAGQQWSKEDLASLRAVRRPALTINKIMSTLANLFGEQIRTRSEVTFKPQRSASNSVADALAKVWKHIAENNQYQWVRSEVFADGSISSRGFYDARMCFDDNVAGDVCITALNPKNVVLDPDADSYDPDGWGDVFVTKWLTGQDIGLYYGKDFQKELDGRDHSAFAFGFDSIELFRDRFGGSTLNAVHWNDAGPLKRNIRVLERQFRVLTEVNAFIDTKTGEWRAVPDGWDRERIARVVAATGVAVDKRVTKRVRWVVTADDIVLHDDWSPYKRFTVIPYFPFFRKGRTVGLVENLLGPQEYLNKVRSQELHVVNTTANSGWKVKAGSLVNMSIEELEARGAQTGIVLELQDLDGAEKIAPNPIPTGLDRISYKAEEDIKAISGRGDSQMGQDRADVAARAIEAKKESGQNTNGTPLDNLERSDWLLARHVLDLIQTYYTDHRILTITQNELTNEQEELQVNAPDEVTGQITNDLTVGEYAVQVISQPYRRTLEESQFQQGLALRELGVPIDNAFLVENSNLMKKGDILKAMEAAAASPEAQLQKQVEMLGQQLQVANLKADASKGEADALLKKAKAEKELANVEEMQRQAQGEDPEIMKARVLAEIELEKHRELIAMKREEHQQKLQQERETHEQELRIRDRNAAQDALLKRAQAAVAMKQAAQQPKSPAQSKQPQAEGA